MSGVNGPNERERQHEAAARLSEVIKAKREMLFMNLVKRKNLNLVIFEMILTKIPFVISN